jgi:hypothetical protein
MISSSVNLHFLMSAIHLVGGLLPLQLGTAGWGQVNTASGLTLVKPELTLDAAGGSCAYHDALR